LPGATFDLSDQVVEVLHDRGGPERSDWSVGSGFVVHGRRVLTAAHNAGTSGELLVRFRGVEEHAATVATLPGGAGALDPDRDLAVLEIDTPVADRPRVRFGRIEAHPQLTTPNLEGCWSIGFPRFQEKRRTERDRPVRESARVDGYVPMGEGLVEGRPTLAATRSPRGLPVGELGQSEWQGMSGAVVFAGPLAVGVVTEHHRPAGGGSLTIAPVALLDERPDAADWWALLGVDDADALLTLPVGVPGPLGEPWAFEAFLASRRRHFTGREWLFDEISAWIADGPGNARLLTGLPGSGKSAALAQIVAGRCGPVLAHHCCLADTPATLDPARFVRSVAAMVAANLPEFADRLSAGDELASRLTEAAVAGDPASAFEAGLLEPLASLPPPLEPQLLVVDALDEALVATGTMTIADLLGPRLGRFPSWLRFLATSRPLPEVRARLGSPPEIRIDEHVAENTDDLRRLVSRRLADGRLGERLAEDGRPREDVEAGVVDAAAGSFLVATMALDAVALGQMTLEDISDLPPGVGSAYGAFFARLFPDPAAYGPARTVLEAVLAAREPLTRQQLGVITGFDDETELPPILQRLAAFVPAREGRYAPFHRSFVEWLSEFDPQTDVPRAGAFAVSVRRGHDRLADWCLKASPPAYRIRHLVTHLAGARRYDELAAAVTDWRWVSAVIEGLHDAGTTSFSLVDDLHAALGALPPEHSSRAVVARLVATVRADAHFLARHPGLWFQSCWNRGWWVDAPEASGAFEEAEPASEPAAERLSTLVESWRGERATGPWLRARWPYPDIGLPILARIADLDQATSAVAFSPGGTTLVSGDETGLRTWDPLTGAPHAAHLTADDYVTGVAFISPTEVVAGTGNGSILALDAANLVPGRTGPPLGGETVRVAALPGRLVAAATDTGSVGIWDPSTGEWRETATPGGTISCFATSPDGRELLIGTEEFEGPSSVRRLRVGHLQEGATWEQQASSWIQAVGWSGDGQTVAWTEYDGTLVIRREGADDLRVTMPDGANGGALVFTEGDGTVACSADDAFGIAKLVVADVGTGEIRASVPSHREAASALAVDPEGRYLASAGSEEIRVWDLAALLSGDHRVARAMVPDIARFLPDGRLVVAADDLEVVSVVDLDVGTVERELPGHTGGVAGVAVSCDGRVACAAGDGGVLLWDPGSWTSQVVTRHEDGASAVAFSRDGRRLATGGQDGVVRLLDLASGTEVASFPVGNVVTDISLAPGDEQLAAATYGSFQVWSVQDRTARTPAVEATTYGLAFTPDGRHVAYVAPGAVVVAVDAETGAEVATEAVHEAARLAELGCRDPRWVWRSPRGRGPRLDAALEMPLVELATGREVAWFPLVWADATPDPTGRTWALLTKRELYVVTLDDG
jgi:WD40 repeat protein